MILCFKITLSPSAELCSSTMFQLVSPSLCPSCISLDENPLRRPEFPDPKRRVHFNDGWKNQGNLAETSWKNKVQRVYRVLVILNYNQATNWHIRSCSSLSRSLKYLPWNRFKQKVLLKKSFLRFEPPQIFKVAKNILKSHMHQTPENEWSCNFATCACFFLLSLLHEKAEHCLYERRKQLWACR